MYAVTLQSEPDPIDPPQCTEEEVRINARRFEVVRVAWIVVAVAFLFAATIVAETPRNGLAAGLFLGAFFLGGTWGMNYSGQPNEWVMLPPHECTTLLRLSETFPGGERYIKAVRNQNRPFVTLDLINIQGGASAWERWTKGAEDRANCRRLYGLDDGEETTASGDVQAAGAGADRGDAPAAT